MKGITPCLWFDTQAEEAVEFYTSIIPDSKIGERAYYGEGSPLPAGTLLTVRFQIQGQEFLALNGGPMFTFNHAVSFVLNCETQEEVDRYWDALAAGGEVEQCGWLRDKYGVSWQIVPITLGKMLECGDPERANRVMQAVLKMVKLDIATLEAAYREP